MNLPQNSNKKFQPIEIDASVNFSLVSKKLLTGPHKEIWQVREISQYKMHGNDSIISLKISLRLGSRPEALQ